MRILAGSKSPPFNNISSMGFGQQQVNFTAPFFEHNFKSK